MIFKDLKGKNTMKFKVLFISAIIVAFVAIFAVLLLIPYEISLIIIILLIGTSIITNLKPNMKFRSDIQEYIRSGYTIDRKEGRFIYKDLLENDDKNGFVTCTIGTHFYTINHTEKEIHIYK